MTPLFRDDLRSARPIGRRAFLRSAAAATAGGAALYAIACGGGGDDGDGAPTATAVSDTPSSGAIQPVLLTSEFVANQDNRFAVGLLSDGKLVRGADVGVRFFTIGADGQTGTFRGEGTMSFVELNQEGAHAHDESSDAVASEDSVSFYVLNTPFDVAGRWGVELNVAPAEGGEPVQVQVPFEVLEASKSPALLTMPPASENDTTATNSNNESLCTRNPICDLHDKVIADVLGKGRPLVVQFSTPAYCETRFCGPVLEVLLAQVPEYRDRVDFVHIEVWQDFQLQQQRLAVTEWNLPTEPYTFFMAADGTVVGKLEAVFTDEELSSALRQLVEL
jgi:hypothetical protein